MKKPKISKHLKKPKVPTSIKKPQLRRKKTTEQKVSDALSTVPRITNDTVADHREEVLSSARKYIYPLQHSKHRIVVITTTLIIAAFVFFMGYSVVSLYRLDGTGLFDGCGAHGVSSGGQISHHDGTKRPASWSEDADHCRCDVVPCCPRSHGPGLRRSANRAA